MYLYNKDKGHHLPTVNMLHGDRTGFYSVPQKKPERVFKPNTVRRF